MRAIGVIVALCVVALAMTATMTEAVPAARHHVTQGVLQQRDALGQNTDCLSEIEKHTGEWEVPTFKKALFSATTQVAAREDHIVRSQKPACEESRATCTDNAEWTFELFRGASAPVVHTTSTGKRAAGMDHWARDVLWENSVGNPFPAQGRVCHFAFVDANTPSAISHQWVVEAPTSTTLRHYQSFIDCYTLKDWLDHSQTEPVEGAKYSSSGVCDYIAARNAIGGGQILTSGRAVTTTYIANIQTLIDEITAGHTFSGVAAAYAAFTGVTIPNTFVWKVPQLVVQCVPRVVRTCGNQERVLAHQVSVYRQQLAHLVNAQTHNDLINHESAFTSQMGRRYADAVAYATGKGWKRAATWITAQLASYTTMIDQNAPHYCDGNTDREYRKVLRGDATFRALKNTGSMSFEVNPVVPAGNRLTKMVQKKSKFVLTCTAAADPNGVMKFLAAAERSTCQRFSVKTSSLLRSDAAATKVDGSNQGGSRFELQMCVDKSDGHIAKARFIPSLNVD